jgi:hypothetical protein
VADIRLRSPQQLQQDRLGPPPTLRALWDHRPDLLTTALAHTHHLRPPNARAQRWRVGAGRCSALLSDLFRGRTFCSSGKSCSASGARSAPFGQTTVPATGSSCARPKYVGSRRGAKTGPASNGSTLTVFLVPSLKASRNECGPQTLTLSIRRIISRPYSSGATGCKG